MTPNDQTPVSEASCRMRVSLMDKTLQEIKDATQRIEDKSDKLDKAVTGNGTPEKGMMFRLIFLEKAVDLNTKFITASQTKKDSYITLIFRTVLIAMISWIMFKLGIHR